MNNNIDIYVDGACSKNPGPGGFGILIYHTAGFLEIKGAERNTTNNRMELKAAIVALKQIKNSSTINLYSDSKYLIDGITKWISNWEKKGWRLPNGKPVKNKELWLELFDLSKKHEIKWNWIKGHSDNKFNEMCDAMAKEAISRYKVTSQF